MATQWEQLHFKSVEEMSEHPRDHERGVLMFKVEGRAYTKGFTLIELMMTVAIIGILAGIALPAYKDSMRKARRPDAKTSLLDLASREERFYSTNNRYSDTPSDLGYSGAWPATIPNAAHYNYALSVTSADSTTFVLQAVPQGDQTNDACGTYILTQTGVQSNTSNTASSASCW
jgi:type IV pilus assembly protein PilE